MGIKLTNNAFATLAAGINSSATSITLTSGQGARFPTLTASDYFYATLVDTSNNLEIVKCTARSTDVLTVVRGQESTTARAYSTGDRIEIRLTAQTFIDATSVYDILTSSTGYFDLPAGTTAQRPGSPVTGMLRYNTTLSYPEYYDGTNWVTISAPYPIDYLVVAGGGGGGADLSGGGGAGGYLASTISFSPTLAYTITIGAGGAGGTAPRESSSSYGKDGVNSSVSGAGLSIIATGGGGGGTYYSGNGSFETGRNGGSGGGGGAGITSTTGAAGVGTSGQGNNGGQAYGGSPYWGGGGGGAGAVGNNATSSSGGNGGNGLNWQSLGTFYAGGGGGSAYGSGSGTAFGTGGSGGGGAGGYGTTAGQRDGISGTANRGGGGGGGSWTGSQPANGGAGGSGIVILRYPGAQKGTGGTVTSAGGYTYHTFTSSGTFTA